MNIFNNKNKLKYNFKLKYYKNFYKIKIYEKNPKINANKRDGV